MISKSIKGLLFDKDGTLILFDESWRPVMLDVVNILAKGDVDLGNRMLEAAGFNTETQKFVAGGIIAGGTTEEVLECWSQFIPRPTPSELEALEKHMLETQVVVPVEGLKSALEGWRQAGYKLGVATNDSENVAHANLKQLGIEHLFDFVAGADSGFGGKPEPGMMHAFCDAVGLKPAQVAMMGDNWHDVEMARNAGAGLVVGVLTGTSSDEQLGEIADIVLPSICEYGTSSA